MTRRFLLLLTLAIHLAGCDRLVLRNDEINLPAPIVTQEQIQNLRTKINKSVGDVGYHESNVTCPVSAKIYCATFKKDRVNADVTVWISSKNPSKLEVGFSSFGDVIDKSGEVFSAIRKEFQ